MKINSFAVRLAVTSSLLLLLSVLSFAQDVKYNYMQGTNFAAFKTYSWVTAPEQKIPNQILDAQIKQAIDEQMALRGLKKITEGMPDIYAIYQVAVDQQTQWYSYSTGGGWWGGMGSSTTTSDTINVGTLVLDLYDTAAKHMVWTGQATKQLKPSNDPEKNLKNLKKAMAKLMKNYPPPVKK